MIDKTPIRLVLADDQTLVRGALAALLGMEDDLEIVGTCGRGDEVVGLVQDTYADVCLLDIEMPGLDGITVAAELRDQAPWCRILIVTTFGRPGYLRRAMDAGVAGFLVKDTPAEDLAQVVRKVHAGGRAIDPALAAESPSRVTIPCQAGNGRSCGWPSREHRSPSSLPSCACQWVRCVTTCPRLLARRARRIALRRLSRLDVGGGCEGRRS